MEGAKTSIYRGRSVTDRHHPLKDIEGRNRDRKKAMRAAYETGAYSYQEIGKHFGVHFTTVGRVVRETKEKPMSKRSGIWRFCYLTRPDPLSMLLSQDLTCLQMGDPISSLSYPFLPLGDPTTA